MRETRKQTRRPFHRIAPSERMHVGCAQGNRRWGATPAARVTEPWEAALYITMRADPIDEKRLWATVLVQALRDFRATGHGSRPLRLDAAGWFGSVSNDLGAFEWCCDYLNQSPVTIRTALVAMRRAERIAPVVADAPDIELTHAHALDQFA